MSITIRMSRLIPWLLLIAAPVIGALLGFVVKPAVQWFVNLLGDAPGPLRAAAALPTEWAVPALAVIGVAVGAWLAHEARKESLELTVNAEYVRLTQAGTTRQVQRDRIAEIFLDGKDLVLLDAQTKELARNRATDLRSAKIVNAFTKFGYPWRGISHPYETDFRPWIDGQDGIDEGCNRLLRSRARALKDKKLGTAADLADQLQSVGITVRDRDSGQEYRSIPLSRTKSGTNTGYASQLTHLEPDRN